MGFKVNPITGNLDFFEPQVENVQSDTIVKIGESTTASNLKIGDVVIGYQAGLSADFGTSFSGGNVVIGRLAGRNVTSANGLNKAIIIGQNAGFGTGIESQIAIGESAGSFNTGTFGMFIGLNAGSNMVGNGNICIGRTSGQTAGSGITTDFCIFIGEAAGNGASGGDTVLLGREAGRDSEANDIIAIGALAGKSSLGNDCIYLGTSSGEGSTLSGQFVVSNTHMPSYADRTAATTAITLGNGAVAGNTYMYYNQATNSIEGVRL